MFCFYLNRLIKLQRGYNYSEIVFVFFFLRKLFPSAEMA